MPLEDNYVQTIYDIVAHIPEGRVTTYGHIARAIGSTRASRVVGWTLNKSHTQATHIPAHRVVNRVGILTGRHHFGTENEMQKRLEAEGISIKDHQVQNFDNLLWDPVVELAL